MVAIYDDHLRLQTTEGMSEMQQQRVKLNEEIPTSGI